ncbi:MAG: TldD/PmbA family protein [Bacilli bacterium]|nr:TldD/PmbA family protein [Bacilli bacterium]
MINKSLAKLVLNEGLKTGADFAELYCEDTTAHRIVLDNGIVEAIGGTSSIGIGLRLLKGNRSVYGYTNEIKKKNLLELANKLNAAFHDAPIKNVTDFKTIKVHDNSPIIDSYFTTPIDEKLNILKLGHETMKNYSPLIVRTTALMAANKQSVEIYNSNGLHYKDYREYLRIFFEPFASSGDKHETSFVGPAQKDGMNFLRKLDIKALATKAAHDAVEALDAKECPSGKMPVIIGNGFGGVLFHEACGHALEATAVARNLSVFANKKGQEIAAKIVTAYDDGTAPHAWGSNNIDDEGNPTNKTCLIKDGVLVNYLIDDFNGRRMNENGNGACRRESYKYEPTSRMSNTYIANGTTPVEEIIKNTKLGLYAKSLGGGSVNPVTGEFEFAVTAGYIVRNGVVMERVRGATLIGKGEEVLKNIDMVGNDLDTAPGFCGASSGYVPNEVGQPTIRVKEILVGGNGGKLV